MWYVVPVLYNLFDVKYTVITTIVDSWAQTNIKCSSLIPRPEAEEEEGVRAQI